MSDGKIFTCTSKENFTLVSHDFSSEVKGGCKRVNSEKWSPKLFPLKSLPDHVGSPR